jgi:sugar lactone lactonase YvrE
MTMSRLPIPTPLVPALALAFLALAACRTEKTPPADTTHATAAQTTTEASAQKLGVLGQMKTPESVKYDADLDAYFVSNINGNPSQKDGNGYIVRIPAESTTTATVIAEGGKNGVRLDAPKGMAIQGDRLYVADIDVVRVLDKRTGRMVKTIDLRPMHAIFLNDIAVGGDSAIYVTDTNVRFDAQGGMSNPGENRIFRIALADDKVTEAAKGAALANPNGITWDAANGRFIVAPFGGKDLQSWKPGEAPTTIASGPGQYDGVELLADGRILVSSWADSSVQVVRDGRMSKLVGQVNAPADIGVDTRRMVLAIPRFSENTVEFWKLP